MAAVRLIVGLGNPGSQYAKTRHNAGAWFVEELALRESIKLRPEAKFFGSVDRLNAYSQPCYVLIPSTFMNESGQSVAALTRFYKIAPEEILVAHDELDLPAGDVKLKVDGGHAGHNGLRDIISHLGTKNFQRLRIGIGHPGHKDKVTPYVLGEPSRTDKTEIMIAIDESLRVVGDLIAGDFEKAQLYLHGG